MEASIYTIDDDFTVNVMEEKEGASAITKSIDEDEKKYEPINFVEIKPLNVTPKSEPAVDTPAQPPQSSAPLKCEICGYRTCSKLSLAHHMEMHENARKLLKCPNCDYETFMKASLSFHKARCISDDKKLKCSQCDFFTLKHKNLRLHVSNVHTLTGKKHAHRVYKCRWCPFKTKENQEYKEHKVEVHEIGKPKECDVCGFQVSSIKKLKKHKTTHNNKIKKAKIYKCDICDYESPYTTNIVTHRAKHIKQ